MTDSIKKYLSETPETLTRLLNNSKDLFKEVSHQDIKRIIVTGSGTSYHSGAEMQQLMREKSGILVEAYYPFMITRDLFKFAPDGSGIGGELKPSDFKKYCSKADKNVRYLLNRGEDWYTNSSLARGGMYHKGHFYKVYSR